MIANGSIQWHLAALIILLFLKFEPGFLDLALAEIEKQPALASKAVTTVTLIDETVR